MTQATKKQTKEQFTPEELAEAHKRIIEEEKRGIKSEEQLKLIETHKQAVKGRK